MSIILDSSSMGWFGERAELLLMFPAWGQLLLGEIATRSELSLVQQIVQALVMGIVQGLSEFLPISSTAHLQVFAKALNWETAGAKPFVATIQFGSVIAVLIYFWKDITTILTGGLQAVQQRDWNREEWKLLVGIAVGTLPALLGGFILKKALNDDKSSINSMITIAVAAIVMALLLGASERFGSRKRNFNDLEILDGILIGVGQAIALIPGASRSGSTLTTALFLGLERQTAARFSFLLGIPTLAIATLYEFFKEVLGSNISLLMVAVGTLSAFVFSYLSIAWLLRYLQTKSTWIFVWYRLAFGAAIIAAVAGRVLPNT